ncbi:MAG: ankyrin repeat domain-containing protein [Pseudomonadota bacterium]
MIRIAALALGLSLCSVPASAQELPPIEERQALLFDAAREGRTDIVEILAMTGVDLNAYDARGFTPVILAAYAGHAQTVSALVAAGADPCLADRAQGNTAQMGVAFRGYDDLAAQLLDTECDVDARNGAGQTALMMAALFGRYRQVEMLITAGADVGIADAEGRTAASVAAVQGNSELAQRLTRQPD